VDGFRFDRWTKMFAREQTSRQGLLRLAAGSGLAAVLGAAEPTVAQDRRCRRNNRPCIITSNDCCSGFCKRTGTGTVGRCRGRAEAKGCTTRDNSCAPRSGDDGVACPRNRNGRCFIQPNGLPLCVTDGGCFNCDSDADCDRRFDRQGGQCIRCGNCERTGRRACLFA
jgi:hypothetical protein